MSVGSTEKRGRTRLRLLQVFGTIAALLLAMGVTALPASAAVQSCSGQVESNVCLTITALGNGRYAAEIGLDYRIGQDDAQTIIDAIGDPVSATVLDDDGGVLRTLFVTPIFVQGASPDAGYSVGARAEGPGGLLNVDSGIDTLRGRVTMYDPRTGTTRTFTTPVVSITIVA
jgi:hypothetical protein